MSTLTFHGVSWLTQTFESAHVFIFSLLQLWNYTWTIKVEVTQKAASLAKLAFSKQSLILDSLFSISNFFRKWVEIMTLIVVKAAIFEARGSNT